MSKVGEKVIIVPASVQVEVSGSIVNIKGKEGSLSVTLPRHISVEKQAENLSVKRNSETKDARSKHGLFRSLIFNAITGVEKPWEKSLEVVGTGYNVKLQGEDLLLKVGYSHIVTFKKEPGVKYKVEGNNKIVVMGVDKQLVGQVAYKIKLVKKPDAYKGKGIKYENEKLRIKPGKKAKTATA